MAIIWTIKGQPRQYWWESVDQRKSQADAKASTPLKFGTIEETLRDAARSGFRYGDPEHILQYDTDT